MLLNKLRSPILEGLAHLARSAASCLLTSVACDLRRAAEKVNWDLTLHRLGLLANPVPPKIPHIARPDYSGERTTTDPLPTLQRRKLRTIGFQVI